MERGQGGAEHVGRGQPGGHRLSTINAEERGWLAANDDRRDHGQCEIRDRRRACPPKMRQERGGISTAQPRRQPGDKQSESLTIYCDRGASDSCRVASGSRNRDMRASTCIVLDNTVLLRTRRCFVMMAARWLRNSLGTASVRTTGLMRSFLLMLLAAGTGPGTCVQAAVFAIVADAEIDRTATPGKELRRHQHQDEQRFGHEKPPMNLSDFVIVSPIL